MIFRALPFAAMTIAGAGVVGSATGAANGPAVATAVSGYVGKGQLVVQTSFGGGSDKLTVGGDIALEQRESKLRIDILSLGIPGAGAAVSSILATQLFPPGGFTVVYDRTASTYAVWSTSKRNYYTNAGSSGAPQTQQAGPAANAIATAGDLFAAFAPARGLKDATAFSASLSLAGHGTVNGHPATGLDYSYARTLRGGDALDVHGRLQLADDLDAVPVEITASVKSKSIPESALRLDLTTLSKQLPASGDFDVPQGYARAWDLGDVVGKVLPH